MNPLSELPSGRVSVLIADADLMSAHLLAGELARGKQDISVVCVSSDSAEAIRELEKYQPDIALLNTHLQDGKMTGYRVLKSLPMACPKTAAIMMIPVADRELVVDAFRGGARGIICRVNALKLLSKCIRTVHGGQIWANNQELLYLLDFLAQLKPLRVVKSGGGMRLLTPREAEVVHLLAEGMSTREISHKVGVTEHTIRNYLSNIYDKLGVSSRVELALYAITREEMPTS
ncbi:MAG: DNA-binding response regulator, LuxR family [Candidatus Acidoferrum typicum]|nr:DNA-binding response regulator, LuxR family [Candidatus Acidoferrum typicum]